jgi:hypothetical protein
MVDLILLALTSTKLGTFVQDQQVVSLLPKFLSFNCSLVLLLDLAYFPYDIDLSPMALGTKSLKFKKL